MMCPSCVLSVASVSYVAERPLAFSQRTATVFMTKKRSAQTGAPFGMEGVSGAELLTTLFLNLPSSPASCGRRSCSAAEPSSVPRQRAPQPR